MEDSYFECCIIEQKSLCLLHFLLQTRTAVLNEELSQHFERWYPGLTIASEVKKQPVELQAAA